MYGFLHQSGAAAGGGLRHLSDRGGRLTAGLLIGFLLYVNSFYGPMRQLATVWSSFQLALAALDRISEVLALESDMPVIARRRPDSDCRARIPQRVISNIPTARRCCATSASSWSRGRPTRWSGPTGGGKTTTASLMARLYDPTEGAVLLNGRDIRSLCAGRARAEGRLHSAGAVSVHRHGARQHRLRKRASIRIIRAQQFAEVLEEANLSGLLARFPEGLDTKVATSGNSISLGQKQLIAFMRAALRKPELLILDEATANIDTVTEQMLEEILEQAAPRRPPR